MPDAGLPRRFALLLIAVLALAALQCQHQNIPVAKKMTEGPELTQEEKEVFCRKGNYSKGRPMICINNATLQPDPETAYVWDYEGVNGNPTNNPVVVHWFTRRTGNLEIVFNEEDCVEAVQCNGRGHCMARVRPLGGGTPRQCKYDILLDGQKNDPGLVVNPCCW